MNWLLTIGVGFIAVVALLILWPLISMMFWTFVYSGRHEKYKAERRWAARWTAYKRRN